MMWRVRKRVAIILALVTLASLLLAVTAWAENITGYFRTTGPGRKVYGDMNGESHEPWAGTLVAEINGENVGTFCTDLEHPIYYDEAFVYEGPATCPVAWLVSNYPPLTSGDSDEMAARQAAVWYLADGFVLNDSTPQNIRDRAQEIIDSVPDPCEVVLETPDLVITPADVTDVYPDEAIQFFTVTATRGGQPVDGLDVSLATDPSAGFTLSDATVTTSQDGTATFSVTASGPDSTQITAEAVFTLPTGMMFSPVDGDGQRLVLGAPVPGSIFAEATVTWVSGGTIVGHVFHDRNMNGVQDGDEESLSGWTVTLYDDGSVELESGATAGEAGNYLFDGPSDNGLAAGSYRVDLTGQAGYQITTDDQITVELEIGGHGVANFGVVQLPVTQVCKYEDLNENGSHDEGEPWLSGWEMQLYEGDDGSAVISGHGFTDDDGCVALGFFDDSYYEESTPYYYVRETLKNGWFNVSPITQSFQLGSDEVEHVYFGNVQPAPAISLEKNGPAYAREGDDITYVFTVTNEGNVKLTGAVTDPMLPDLTCSFADLAPGQSHVCYGSYTIPQGADDPLLNTASVSADDAYGHTVGDDDDHSVDIIYPGIAIVKTADPTVIHAGDTVLYTYEVTNPGDDPVSDVSVSDDKCSPLVFSGGDANGDDNLDPGETWTYTCSAALSADTVNTATAEGTDALGETVSDSDTASVDVITPGIEVVKTALADSVPEGDPVQWTITVYNRGDATLYDVTVTDSNGMSFGPLTLTPDDGDDQGGTDQATWTYTTYPDEDVTNVATASGHDVLDLTVTDEDDASVGVTTGGDGDPDDVGGGDDADGDGTPGYEDTDSDGDGIPDQLEGDGDADGDGTPNYLDTDSDGDGIPDQLEGDGDADGDGTPNYLDTDSDGDGIPDEIETDDDADGDGTPNFLDLDSDGDGIPDEIETADDTDGDGTPNFLDLDSDGDGIPDAIETADDADGDGTPNFLDLDSDGDGIPDAIETADDADGDGTPNFLDLDSDGDGIPDGVEAGDDPGNPLDSDGDGTPDFLDLDSDGDGILDSVEAGDDPSHPVDSDDDGTPDYLDTDSDGDGIPDADEWSTGADDPLAGCTADDPVCFDNDADGDGTPNYLDPDSDGDGYSDEEEGLGDGDGDGVPDWLDPNPRTQSDQYYMFLPFIKKGP